MRILIADDSDLLRQRVGEIVSAVPNTVVYQARDGLEALRLNEVMSPEIVVLDIRMPGKNGIDVLKDIKKRRNPPCVIVLTNYAYPQYRQRCTALGADYFFEKSGEFEALRSVLRGLVNGEQQVKRNIAKTKGTPRGEDGSLG